MEAYFSFTTLRFRRTFFLLIDRRTQCREAKTLFGFLLFFGFWRPDWIDLSLTIDNILYHFQFYFSMVIFLMSRVHSLEAVIFVLSILNLWSDRIMWWLSSVNFLDLSIQEMVYVQYQFIFSLNCTALTY